jgi:hypothetical protein
VEIMSSNRLGESQFLCKHRRDTDLVRLNIHIWRNDRPRSVVDSLALRVL